MRSLILALALAAPVSAVASTPMYSNPMSRMHHQKVQEVFLTFENKTVQDREVVIDGLEYRVPCLSTVHLHAPVGSPVFVFSQTNSKVHGQELMRVSPNDADKNIPLT
ncbi:MAG: hypothetical protein ABR971_12010 [Acidobacteriaceae bacterium]|jgi:hypothetical protein